MKCYLQIKLFHFSDNSVFKKHDDEYKVNFKCITRNEMLKIYFNDIQCFIKKSDVCKQEIVDLEQSDLNFGKIDLAEL